MSRLARARCAHCSFAPRMGARNASFAQCNGAHRQPGEPRRQKTAVATSRPPRARRGLSVIEIMVVVALASLVLLGGSVLMSRTSRGYKKGTDMINTQVLLDSIVERLRTDIRSLVYIDQPKPHRLEFIANLRGEPRKILYEYDEAKKTLTRTETGVAGAVPSGGGTPVNTDNKTDFRGAGQVMALVFDAVVDPPMSKNFHHLDLAVQLMSDEKGTGPGSRLSIMCHFYSKCLESPNPYRR